VPRNVELSNDLATFSLVFERKGPGEVRVAVSFELRVPRVKKADYPRFREFAVALDKAETEEIVMVRGE
jgi:hypothetical protein